MANTDNNTVQLSISKESKYIEAIAAADVQIGALCEITATGLIQHHSTADGDQSFLFAVEDSYGGYDYSDLYPANERVFARQCRTGDKVLAWLNVGQAVTKGGSLSSAGNGFLQAAPIAPTDSVLVGFADEDVDATAASARISITIY